LNDVRVALVHVGEIQINSIYAAATVTNTETHGLHETNGGWQHSSDDREQATDLRNCQHP
jgi:hypothetical protein